MQRRIYLFSLSQFLYFFSPCNKWIWLHLLNRRSLKLIWHKWLFCHCDFTAIVFSVWGLLVISLLISLSFPILLIVILNLHAPSSQTEAICLKSQQLPPRTTVAWPWHRGLSSSREIRKPQLTNESSKMPTVQGGSLRAQISCEWVLPMERSRFCRCQAKFSLAKIQIQCCSIGKIYAFKLVCKFRRQWLVSTTPGVSKVYIPSQRNVINAWIHFTKWVLDIPTKTLCPVPV